MIDNSKIHEDPNSVPTDFFSAAAEEAMFKALAKALRLALPIVEDFDKKGGQSC